MSDDSDDFLCARYAARYRAFQKPADGRYKDMLTVRYFGSEESKPEHTNWAITTGFDLLIFFYRAHHAATFYNFGFAEEDMLLTGSGQSIRGGYLHPSLVDDPESERELVHEVRRLFREHPYILKKHNQ